MPLFPVDRTRTLVPIYPSFLRDANKVPLPLLQHGALYKRSIYVVTERGKEGQFPDQNQCRHG